MSLARFARPSRASIEPPPEVIVDRKVVKVRTILGHQISGAASTAPRYGDLPKILVGVQFLHARLVQNKEWIFSGIDVAASPFSLQTPKAVQVKTTAGYLQ